MTAGDATPSLALYMDEHVPRPVTDGLRARGIDVLRVQDDGFMNIPDPEVLDHATELGRLLFSHDVDLLVEAAYRQQRGIPFEGLVYCRQLDLPIGQIIDDLELICAATRAG